MFTGIIEKAGTIKRLESRQERLFMRIDAEGFTDDIKLGASIAVDGVCLTVTSYDSDGFEVDAVKETLKRTTITGFKAGRRINLEKAVRLSDRLDGHLVQGHVDGTATMTKKKIASGNILLTFKLEKGLEDGVVDKGSIAIDGISLTVVNLEGLNVTVTIVPYTYEHTTLKERKPGDTVNIETDIIGKYIAKFTKNGNGRKSIAPMY